MVKHNDRNHSNHDHHAKQPSQQEPLSGSKKVKNRNHSRNNHGEGS